MCAYSVSGCDHFFLLLCVNSCQFLCYSYIFFMERVQIFFFGASSFRGQVSFFLWPWLLYCYILSLVVMLKVVVSGEKKIFHPFIYIVLYCYYRVNVKDGLQVEKETVV